MEAPLPSFHRARPGPSSAAAAPASPPASASPAGASVPPVPASHPPPARRTAPGALAGAHSKRPRISSPPVPAASLPRQLERMRTSLHTLDRLPTAAPVLRPPPSASGSSVGSASSHPLPCPKDADGSGTSHRPSGARKAFSPTENKKKPSSPGARAHGSPLQRDSHHGTSAAGRSSPMTLESAAGHPSRPPRSAHPGPSKHRKPKSPASMDPSLHFQKKRPAIRPPRPRWSTNTCQAQYHAYRDVAHSVKKRADALANSPGGLSGKKWDTVGLMLADSFFLYAYGSWARDQRLRFDGEDAPDEEPPCLPLERSTDGRGVNDWEQLFPLLEHAMHQLRKRSDTWATALDAVLLMLQARITFLRAAYAEGWVTRYLTRPSSGKGPDVGLFASHLSTALVQMDDGRNMENKARATLCPAVLEKSFPHTWAALGVPSADLATASASTLALDPSSLETIADGSGFLSRSSLRPTRKEGGPIFPPPNGADGPAHLILLGRMLVAETAQKEGLDYELASVALPAP